MSQCRTVARIQREIVKLGKRSPAFQIFRAKNDKDTIAAWRRDLDRILHVFNVRSLSSARHSITTLFQTELAINTHMRVVDGHRNMLTDQEGGIGLHQSVSTAFYSLSTRH